MKKCETKGCNLKVKRRLTSADGIYSICYCDRHYKGHEEMVASLMKKESGAVNA